MKIVGVGLSKTGTKTLGTCLGDHFGYRHKTYDLAAFNQYRRADYAALMDTVAQYDSFEDWPWPLLYREIDAHFPESKFILTVRENPELWYESLCKMAVRLGPMKEFDQHIYGYATPYGHKEEYVRFYQEHNQAVEAYFRGRPGKLLTVCWETGDGWEPLATFLGKQVPSAPFPHVNQSAPFVYSGENRTLARVNRMMFLAYKRAKRLAGLAGS
jgi:hypothetical protein